ncbi:hypothetical protein KTS45_16015 [Halomicroarcula limicola]|uniref:Uncharacterized protein n=1 Tax=Haloarcula limicola TaxID=1429915 RepID=A0A8J7Y6P7_9EURY|nr:hypothetical protein [Halomicroarcula limicola]MBV0925710.1 hypothetical protein [Halomicroarcula limicola]
MSPSLFRLFASVGVPVIVFLALVGVFEPETIAGGPASIAAGAAMTGFVGWCCVVALVSDAPWTAAGFLVLTLAFGVQFLSPVTIETDAVVYAVVGVAVVLLLVGGDRDDLVTDWAELAS